MKHKRVRENSGVKMKHEKAYQHMEPKHRLGRAVVTQHEVLRLPECRNQYW
jgi:hypothetical protein